MKVKTLRERFDGWWRASAAGISRDALIAAYAQGYADGVRECLADQNAQYERLLGTNLKDKEQPWMSKLTDFY